MEKYRSYKYSGEDWLGMIPEHWLYIPLRRCCTFIREKAGDSSTKHISLENIESWTGHYIETDSQYEGLGINTEENDILFGKLRPYLAKVYLTKQKLNALGDFWVLRPNKALVPKYLHYTLLSPSFIDIVNSSTYGAKMPRADWGTNSKIVMPVPPLDEQLAIVSYLDRVTGEIDKAIEHSERMIDLLNERKQIIIQHAVTKGLDPNVKLKDSGIEWIGMIPEEWEIIKTSYIFHNIGSGTTPSSGSSDYYSNDGTYFLQTGDLNDAVVTSTAKRITQKAINNKGMKLYPEGSLVIAMYGATIGKLGLLGIKTTVNQACCVLPVSKRMNTKYAFYIFLTAKKDLILQSKGGGQPNISQDIIKNERIIVPPLSIQQQIVNYIDRTLLPLDSAITSEQQKITLLRERRQIIINDVVTGKVKVS